MSERYCLCCGKPLQEEGSWHKECLHRFFSSPTLPQIDLNADEIKAVALAQLSEKKGVAGVQKKLSLHLDLRSKKRPRLTLVGFPSGYILKPQSSAYRLLPELEHTAMLLAECCGLPTVPHGLVPLANGELAYITKRVDRDGEMKIHMEDFCQASGNVTANKYRSSYEECMELISAHSSRPSLDRIRLFACVYFDYLIGNSDAHLKNFSFVLDEKGRWSLAPFYDLLPTRLILPSDHEDLGLLLNGHKTNLRKHDFDAFAVSSGIPIMAQEKTLAQIDSCFESMCAIIDASPLDQNTKTSWKRMVRSNIRRAKLP